MDLPDCPPGAEGYEDTVVQDVQVLKPELEISKAEQEFHQHLKSLKIRVEDEDGTVVEREMVERRGRDVSGKCIYLCFPCAATCSGENVLQTHISGKKHKNKIGIHCIWPYSIFTEHPYVLNEKEKKTEASDKVVKKMAEHVNQHIQDQSSREHEFSKYMNLHCHIQDALDSVKSPLLGLEYLVEHPPEQDHHGPTYQCTLCMKAGHHGTIINHLTSYWHRFKYISRHYTRAAEALGQFRVSSTRYREGVSMTLHRLAARIEDKFGRLKPLHIDLDEYNRDKDKVNSWICKGFHFSEQNGPSFEEVVDVDLIKSLHQPAPTTTNPAQAPEERKTSPPRNQRPYARGPPPRGARREPSLDALSDISVEERPLGPQQPIGFRTNRYDPYKRVSPSRNRWAQRKIAEKNDDKGKAPNHDHKISMAQTKREQVEEAAVKSLEYHQKNPEKHPLYPEEWKKFWGRRYKELQAEGKDPSKYDFKPEWIVFWTKRMKELHNEELQTVVNEIYRRYRLTPPDVTARLRSRSHSRSHDDERRRRDAEVRKPDYPRRRSPLGGRRGSPPSGRRGSPSRRHSPFRRHSPPPRQSPPPRRRSPPRDISRRHRTRSRSPLHTRLAPERSPVRRGRASPSRGGSPLSRRHPPRNRSPDPAPAQSAPIAIVDLSNLSPWNSEDSLGSLPDVRSPPRAASHSRGDSVLSRSSHRSRSRLDPRASYDSPNTSYDPDDVIGALRVLVALEDYLGSLGPKVVELLTEALKMEKVKANSAEEILDRSEAIFLMETAKEKLKGALQAGLLVGGQAAARAAITRVAALLHHADKRAATNKEEMKSSRGAGGMIGSVSGAGGGSVPLADGGEVDRAQIAAEIAAALEAQGKTDVSAAELAHLVDTVVDVTKAKKRAAAQKAAAPAVMAPRASALQMLQSAYDEYDKKPEKEESTDAMDGLSDSDLETLLKNFNELSAEEQHSLIAYLKKLEAREPKRVERLREYVTAAANSPQQTPAAPPQVNPAPAAAPPPPPPSSATAAKLTSAVQAIESDDDDYTVEEVLQVATQKVKADQLRQEMEIVKKSLEGAPGGEEAKNAGDIINITSAAGLLAMVQASLAQAPAAAAAPADVTSSALQPRSFGDVERAPPAPAAAPALPLTYDRPPPPPPPPDNRSHKNQPAFAGNSSQNHSNFAEPSQQSQNIVGGNVDQGQNNFAHMPPQSHGNFRGNDNYGNVEQGNYGGSIPPQDNWSNMGHNQNDFGNNQDNNMYPNQGNYGNNMAGNQSNFGNQQSPWDGGRSAMPRAPNAQNFNNPGPGNFNNTGPGNYNNSGPGNFNNLGPRMFNNSAPGNFNSGPRNFNNGPGNFNKSKPNQQRFNNPQQFGNNKQQFGNNRGNFRGRGGNRGGRGRGRGH